MRDFSSARSGRSFRNLIVKFIQKLFGTASDADQIVDSVDRNFGPNRSSMENANEVPEETVTITIPKVYIKWNRDKVINYSRREKDTTVRVRDNPSEIYKRASHEADSLLDLVN